MDCKGPESSFCLQGGPLHSYAVTRAERLEQALQTLSGPTHDFGGGFCGAAYEKIKKAALCTTFGFFRLIHCPGNPVPNQSLGCGLEAG